MTKVRCGRNGTVRLTARKQRGEQYFIQIYLINMRSIIDSPTGARSSLFYTICTWLDNGWILPNLACYYFELGWPYQQVSRHRVTKTSRTATSLQTICLHSPPNQKRFLEFWIAGWAAWNKIISTTFSYFLFSEVKYYGYKISKFYRTV